jgi:hypothetical protein
MKHYNVLTAIILMTICWTGCKKDKDPVPLPPPVSNDGEVITTLKLTFTDSANTSDIRYATFRDPDGDGGQGPDIFDTIRLAPNKTWYTGILLLNETVTPADTISNEVLEEANDHRFCFTPSGTSAVVTITDLDGNNLPIGLQSKWRTAGIGLGAMQIELRHQPGIKDGTCTPGSTDVDVTFQTKIQ